MVAQGELLCYILPMMHFYGYGRAPEDAPPDCDETWLDAEGSDRVQRADMLCALRKDAGDVVVVLAKGDLGKGAEAAAIADAIEALGATLEVRAPEKPAPQKPGRKPQFQPSPEADAKYRTLYHSYLAKRYVWGEIRKGEGWPVSWDQIKRRYGKRWDRNEPLEGVTDHGSASAETQDA